MIGNVNQPSTNQIMDVDGTLKAGAVDVEAVLADNVVTAAKIADNVVGAGYSAGSDLTLEAASDRIGAAASASGSIGTSIDTDGTLKAGAVDVAAVLADNVVETAKIKDAAVTLAKLAADVEGALNGGELITDERLIEWTAAGAYEMIALAYDNVETTVVSNAIVKWPDGTAGEFVTISINATHHAIDAYTISHPTAGKLVTQAAVTRNGAGYVTTRPALTISAVTWTDVTPPTGWLRSLPFTVQRSSRSFRAWDASNSEVFDFADYAPTGKAYYVATDGNDANSGLDAAHPLRNVRTAFAKADIVTCYIAAGVYADLYGWWTAILSKSLSIIATGGRVIMSGHYSELVWALDGTLTNTYKVTRSNIGGVLDTTVVDANGDYSALTKRASAADVDANPGSWYLDGSNVLWVRLADDRAPDANVFPQAAAGTMHPISGNGTTVYVEGIDFVGGYVAASVLAIAPGQYPTVYYNDCTFKHATNSNGLTILGGDIYLQDCIAARNFDDGFNYHNYVSVVPNVVEIDCTGRDNGATGDIDNGSTAHDGVSILRLNGEYCRNAGRNIHDISSATQSWNCGCYAHDSASATADVDFAAGIGVGETTVMWLDRCHTSGSAYDLAAIPVAATIHTRNCILGTGSNTGGGTIDTY